MLLLSKKTQRTQCIISLKVYIYIFYYLLRISRTYSTQLWQICITLTKIMQKNESREREWYHSFWNQKETEAEIWSWHCHECLINKKSETQKKKKNSNNMLVLGNKYENVKVRKRVKAESIKQTLTKMRATICVLIRSGSNCNKHTHTPTNQFSANSLVLHLISLTIKKKTKKKKHKQLRPTNCLYLQTAVTHRMRESYLIKAKKA